MIIGFFIIFGKYFSVFECWEGKGRVSLRFEFVLRRLEDVERDKI